jgi:hypothetical protein
MTTQHQTKRAIFTRRILYCEWGKPSALHYVLLLVMNFQQNLCFDDTRSQIRILIEYDRRRQMNNSIRNTAEPLWRIKSTDKNGLKKADVKEDDRKLPSS